MSRGGARVGAGRKPRRALEFPVFDGGLSGAVSTQPPEDLPEAQRPHWVRYAKLAISRGTLTENTEPAFRLLCQTEAEIAVTQKTIDADGRTFIKCTVDGAGNEHQELKGHPLLSHYRSLLKSQQNLFEKFMLGPFGKPIATRPRSAVDQQKAQDRTKFFGVRNG